MNVVGWFAHAVVLWWSWPLIRQWWHGKPEVHPYSAHERERKRWAVVASFLLPLIAWFWLVPLATACRWRAEEQERAQRQSQQAALRTQDVAFWRDQVATGDLISCWVGIELLAMWGVPVAEQKAVTVARPERDDWANTTAHARDLICAGYGIPEALPGAHAYSHGCGCRNCVRARGDLAPPMLFPWED